MEFLKGIKWSGNEKKILSWGVLTQWRRDTFIFLAGLVMGSMLLKIIDIETNYAKLCFGDSKKIS